MAPERSKAKQRLLGFAIDCPVREASIVPPTYEGAWDAVDGVSWAVEEWDRAR